MTEPRTREGSALSSVDDLLRRERGMALVAILLVMLVLSMLAVVFLQSINIETNVSDYSLRKSKSLSIAEAGIAEAISRIRAGDVPDSLNPRMVSQIFLAAAGSLPALGQDSIPLATEPSPLPSRPTPPGPPSTATTRTRTRRSRRLPATRFTSSRPPGGRATP